MAATVAAKPVFMTKAQRQKLEEDEKTAKAAVQKKREEEERKVREAFLASATQAAQQERERERDRGRDRDRGRYRRETDAEREERKRKERSRDGDKSSGAPTDPGSAVTEGERQKQQEVIKQHYLGVKQEKKRLYKPSDKFKFVFDWKPEEDTSKDINPIYSTPMAAKPIVGKGVQGDVAMRDAPVISPSSSTMAASTSGVRDKHWSEKARNQMTERDWRIFKEDFNISTRGGAIPNPLRNWEEAELPATVREAIAKANYVKPTPIQMQAIPIGLQNRDILGMAETGSGKTAAFVVPMLVYISRLPRMTPETEGEGPYALIMAPSRELVLQIETEVQKLAAGSGIRCVAIVGGTSIEEQGFALRQGCEIVVATPGRLKDCLERRYIVLNQCNYVVLDEGDRMIDLGFEEQVVAILDAMPSARLKSQNEEEAAKQEQASSAEKIYRTTHLYSATMPVGVERLARKYLRRAAYISIGEVGRTVDRIEQHVEFVRSDADKRARLLNLLTTGPKPPVIVFVNTKKTGDAIAGALIKAGFKSIALHSGRTQEQREAAMDGFRAGKYDVLVATDVASRGIDVKGVTHVINYDMPKNIEDYTHRVGRTGRAGSSGLATSFLLNDDTDIMYDLKVVLQQTKSTVPPELARHPAAHEKKGSIGTTEHRKDQVIFIGGGGGGGGGGRK